MTERFQAAIAYYPACFLPLVTLTAPTLILAGEQDDWTPAERCREMVAHARPDSAPIALHIYPDAHHAFDVAVLQPGRRAFGHSVEYNEAAAKDAEKKRHGHFLPLTSPRQLAVSRLQSEEGPKSVKRLLIASSA